MNSNLLLPKDKTILLDLGGVVFNSTGSSNETIHWSVIAELNEQFGHRLNVGEDCFQDFMQTYNSQTEQQLSGALFLKQVFDTLVFNQPLIDLLQPHFNIIIVSDNYRENIAYIEERYQFSSWSEAAYYSYDFEMVKGNPDFFVQLKKEINLPVEHLLLIDDSINKLASAKRNEIQGICYRDVNQVNTELKEKYWL